MARFLDVDPDPGVASAERSPGLAATGYGDHGTAEASVSSLYQASALSLIRLAYVMLGDLPSAEDVVQEAFVGLYRHWDRLTAADGAAYYVRASVLNGCRSVLRRRAVRRRRVAEQPPTASAEAVVLGGEEREEVIRALGRLNGRIAVRQPKNAAGEAYWIQARVTPDGRTVIAIKDRLRRKVSQQLVAFSTATGKVRQVLSDVTFLDADDEQVQWMTPSGSKLIVTGTRPAHAAHAPFYEANAGVLSGGHYAPLPWSARTFAAAW